MADGINWANPGQAVDPSKNAGIASNLNQYYTRELAAINNPRGQQGQAYGQAMPSMPEPPKFDPFSRPGDGRGDAEMRQQQYESLLKQAATGSGITSRQREAMINSAQAMMAPGLAQGKQQADLHQNQMGGYLGQMQAGFPGYAGYPGLNSIGAPQQPMAGATSPYSLQKPTVMPGQANQPATTPTTNPTSASALPGTSPFGNSRELTDKYNNALNIYQRTA